MSGGCGLGLGAGIHLRELPAESPFSKDIKANKAKTVSKEVKSKTKGICIAPEEGSSCGQGDNIGAPKITKLGDTGHGER